MEFDFRLVGICFSSLSLIVSAAVLITSRNRGRTLNKIQSDIDKIHDGLQNVQQGIYKIESRYAKDITPRQDEEPKQLPPPR